MYITNSFLCQRMSGFANPFDDCISDNINTPLADRLERNLGIPGSAVAAIICTASKFISLISSIFLILATILIVMPIVKIFNFFNNDDFINLNQEGKEQFDILETSLNDLPALQQLVEQVKSGEEQAPFSNLKAFWDKGGPKEKTVFIDVFSTDDDPSYSEVRNNLAHHIFYRPPLKESDTQSLIRLTRNELPSKEEITDILENPGAPGKLDIGTTATKVDLITRRLLAECQFFHGTEEKDTFTLALLKSILTAKQININVGS